MKFVKTKLNNVYLVELEKKEDNRGFLARTWGVKEFSAQGVDFNLMEGYITYSKDKGTIRGFHYLKVDEKKLTKVLKGSVYEVVIDVRSGSSTYKQWEAFALKDSDYKMLYMGPGIAHAILTLEDDTELMSLYSPSYTPENEGGMRFNDPNFNIPWPIKIKTISEKDNNWPVFSNGTNSIKQEKRV